MANSKHARVRADTTLRQMPNVGPAFARDLALLDIARPADLVGPDGLVASSHVTMEEDPVAAVGAAGDELVGGTTAASLEAERKPWSRFLRKRDLEVVHGGRAVPDQAEIPFDERDGIWLRA